MKNKKTSRKNLSRRHILKYGLYGGITAAISSNLLLSSCSQSFFRKKKNVFLVTVDTLRADHLGCYGYHRNTSPNIDRFALEAMLFEKCFSHAPVTSSSCASILTGMYPHETKVFENLPLPKQLETLPETLKKHNYKTIAVVSNFNLRRKTGWAQGFDIFDDKMAEHEINRNLPERTALNTTNCAIEFVKKFHKENLFFWIHYQDPHGPYTPPENYSKPFLDQKQKPKYLKINQSVSGYNGIPSYQNIGNNKDYNYYVAQYDGEIRYQDQQFKHFIDTLKDLNLYDESLIIFSSDHGEGMGEHDYYFAHGENLYNSLTHVPLIIKSANSLKGKRSDFVQHLDIVPTILHFLGIKPDSRFRGADLRLEQIKDRPIFAEMISPFTNEGFKLSLVFNGLKLIYTPRFEKHELFNLQNDHYERINLSEKPEYKKQISDLRLGMKRIVSEDFLKLNIINKPVKMTDDEIRKLRSLGYVQ